MEQRRNFTCKSLDGCHIGFAKISDQSSCTDWHLCLLANIAHHQVSAVGSILGPIMRSGNCGSPAGFHRHQTAAVPRVISQPSDNKNIDSRRTARTQKHLIKYATSILRRRTSTGEQNTMLPRYFSLQSSTAVDPTRPRSRSTATGRVGWSGTLIRTCRRKIIFPPSSGRCQPQCRLKSIFDARRPAVDLSVATGRFYQVLAKIRAVTLPSGIVLSLSLFLWLRITMFYSICAVNFFKNLNIGSYAYCIGLLLANAIAFFYLQ